MWLLILVAISCRRLYRDKGGIPRTFETVFGDDDWRRQAWICLNNGVGFGCCPGCVMKCWWCVWNGSLPFLASTRRSTEGEGATGQRGPVEASDLPVWQRATKQKSRGHATRSCEIMLEILPMTPRGSSGGIFETLPAVTVLASTES